MYYDAEGTLINYIRTNGKEDNTVKFTTPSNIKYLVITFGCGGSNTEGTFSKVRLIETSKAAPFITSDTQVNKNSDHTLTALWTQANYSISSGTQLGAMTLSDAVSICDAGGTITALANTSESDSITINKNITIDTNGKTLTRTGSGQIKLTGGTTIISGNGGITGDISNCEFWN